MHPLKEKTSPIYRHKRTSIMQDIIKYVQEQTLTQQVFPKFKVGDNITVSYKIIEGDKSRTQMYRGDVIQMNGSGMTKTFTVRKISNGVGVERVFPFASPNIEKIEVNKFGHVRRAKLYYLRDAKGKKARIRERKYFKAAAAKKED